MTRSETELDAYKRAMDDAFQQLDWCINYLQRIQKNKFARRLARSRASIAKQSATTPPQTDGPTKGWP
jgi:hypothetical protein